MISNIPWIRGLLQVKLSKYDAARQAAMRAQMERIRAKVDLSDNTREIISKSLDAV